MEMAVDAGPRLKSTACYARDEGVDDPSKPWADGKDGKRMQDKPDSIGGLGLMRVRC